MFKKCDRLQNQLCTDSETSSLKSKLANLIRLQNALPKKSEPPTRKGIVHPKVFYRKKILYPPQGNGLTKNLFALLNKFAGKKQTGL